MRLGRCGLLEGPFVTPKIRIAGQRADLAPYGAGEASHKPLIAAIANAIHDATGVRMRRPPFRKEQVFAALKAANV